MSEKKDLLPYILIMRSPRRAATLRFMATDAGEGMQITKWAIASIDACWSDSVAAMFDGFVDPRTIQFMKERAENITGIMREETAVWLAPSGFPLES